MAELPPAWMTRHWTVSRIDHLYDEGIAAGSDHAVIVADLTAAWHHDQMSLCQIVREPPFGTSKGALQCGLKHAP